MATVINRFVAKVDRPMMLVESQQGHDAASHGQFDHHHADGQEVVTMDR